MGSRILAQPTKQKRFLAVISALIVLARREKLPINLNNFSISRVVRVESGRISVNAGYSRQFISDVGLAGKAFGVGQMRQAIRELVVTDRRCWIRGKYLLEWFFIMVRAMRQRLKSTGVRRGLSGKKARWAEFGNARELLMNVAVRMGVPPDLNDFLNATLPGINSRARAVPGPAFRA